jgi:hypothetical protein
VVKVATFDDSDLLVTAKVTSLLQTLTVATANVFAGQVYKVVFVTAVKFAAPSLPVAMLLSPNIFMLRKN